MRYFVQYHNAERYGPLADDFVIHSRRPVQGLMGQWVWLIGGVGRPRQYALLKGFCVDEIGTLVNNAGNYARGSTGWRFDPPVLLSGRQGFARFLRSQANFSLGLREIHDRDHLAMLRAAAVEGGFAQ